MRKLQLIIDSDEILFNTIKRVLDLYNEEYELNYTLEDINDWNLCNCQLPGTNMTKYFEMPGFFKSLEPIDGAQEYLKKIYEDGHKILIATASPKFAILDKIEHIRNTFPFLQDEDIVAITHKNLLKGDIMFDDGLHNISKSICDYPVIMNAPWNRSGVKYKRVNSWKEFYEYVQEIAKN